METYKTIGTISDFGASLATSGLGDLASVQGRFTEAGRILEQGAARDLKSERADWAAAKFAALAHTELWRGRPREAIAAADKALVHDDGRECSIHGGASLRPGGRGRESASARRRRWPRSLWPSRAPTRKSSRGKSR